MRHCHTHGGENSESDVLTMSAPCSPSVRIKIRQTYGNRCAICLNQLPEVGIQSAHLIDSAAVGGVQVCIVEISRQASQPVP
jgi:hypothetical protein